MHPSFVNQKTQPIIMSSPAQKNLWWFCRLKEQRISSIRLGVKTQAPTCLSGPIPQSPTPKLHWTTHRVLCTPCPSPALCSSWSLCRSRLCLLNTHPPFKAHHKRHVLSEIFPNLSNRNVLSSTVAFRSSVKASSRVCSLCLTSQLSVGLPALQLYTLRAERRLPHVCFCCNTWYLHSRTLNG